MYVMILSFFSGFVVIYSYCYLDSLLLLSVRPSFNVLIIFLFGDISRLCFISPFIAIIFLAYFTVDVSILPLFAIYIQSLLWHALLYRNSLNAQYARLCGMIVHDVRRMSECLYISLRKFIRGNYVE